MTAAAVRTAIARVSAPAEDLAADRAEADRVVAGCALLTQVQLYATLVAAGLDLIRPSDSKAYLLRRLHNRLTARVRAWERTEV